VALFRFLHVSDLHLGATAEQLGLLPFAKSGFALKGYTGLASVSSHREDILEGLAILADAEGPNLDGIIITGDLATTGDQPDVQRAHDFIHGAHSPGVAYQTPAGEPTLNNPSNVNVYLIPGNHDRYDGRLMLPGGVEFDKLFGAGGTGEWPVGQSAYLIDVLTDRGFSLALIGGDFSLRSAADVVNPAHLLGAGRAYDAVVTEMENLTDQVRAQYDPVEVVWLTHFPPRFPSAPALLPLLDEDRLVAAALGKKINYLLAGHTHEEDQYSVLQPHHLIHGGRSVSVMCGGTTTEHRLPHSADPRTAHLLEFNIWPGGSCTVSKHTLSWDDNLNYWV
jgi:predicted phosphodiesterase